jgi:3-hydroxybutyryl-CoA dehydratase
MERLYFNDVNVGDEWTTLSRTVTEADIVNFAGLSGDFNPLHMDEEFAKNNTAFKKRIAHGLLTLAIQSGLGAAVPAMRTMAFVGIKEWNFKGPVFIGDTITLKNKVEEKRLTSKGDRGIVTWRKQVVNQRGEVVQEGMTMTMVEARK